MHVGYSSTDTRTVSGAVEKVTQKRMNKGLVLDILDMAGDEYGAWQAEIRVLRAMYYWYLIDLFGDVPLILRTDISMHEVTRTPRSEVFQFCVNELETVFPQLSEEISVQEGDYYGRITQSVALFVLAKLMLNSSVYLHTDNVDEQLKKMYQLLRFPRRTLSIFSGTVFPGKFLSTQRKITREHLRDSNG